MVTDVERMGRILKLLVGALESLDGKSVLPWDVYISLLKHNSYK